MGTRSACVVLALVTALLLAGTAWAKDTETSKAKESKVTKQGLDPKGEVGKTTGAGSQLEEEQTGLEVAESRTRDLDRKTRNLQKDLETQREAEGESRVQLEKSLEAAYRGEDLAGATLVLNSMLGGEGTKFNVILGGTTGRVLSRGRESIQFRRDSQRALKDTIRQFDQQKKKSKRSQEKQRERIEELRRRGVKLEVSIGGSSSKKERLEERIVQLETADQAGEIIQPPASGSGGAGPVAVERELEIAEEDIVALPVEPIPFERYEQIYKAAAKRYGFEEDWYVLAAVGKVESDHGQNMGPSSAGAMGPMQFLPSTWSAYGVDGNKDGVANIMDPEDAIPAAARYLEDGGAPDDGYAALYVYNHAGWYVREVLGVAEGYRRLAEDDEVEPYV